MGGKLMGKAGATHPPNPGRRISHGLPRPGLSHPLNFWLACAALFLLPVGMAATAAPLASSLGRTDKKPAQAEGFAIDLKASEADVAKAVQFVSQDTIIHGTQVYAREDTLTEAEAVTSSAFYGVWQGPGQVFYKIRRGALSPTHFKNSADIGIITVRYVVLAVTPDRTHVQIDAAFVEDATKRVHVSDTTVETSEFAEIQGHLLQIQREEQQTADALQRRELQVAAQSNAKERDEEAARLKDAEGSVTSLELRLHNLQHDAEMRVKAQASLKSAPFQHAATLQPVPANSDVLIEIITPFWYGIETVDGHRGWLRRDQLEPLP